MAAPNSNDLFLINKDINGDGSVYETYHVKYGDMLGPVTGPPGVSGPSGPTGPAGIPGADGSSVKILGVYADWATFSADTGIYTGSTGGDMYVITNGEGGPNGGNIVAGETNVASVYNEGTTKWERVGPITGPDGATGSTGPGYASVINGPGADDISFVPNPDHPNQGNQVITDVRGATGPYYDIVEDDFTVQATDPITNLPQVDEDGNPVYEHRLIFKSSQQPDPDIVVPDGNNPLPRLVTDDVRGATGPNAGAMGATGPGFDDINKIEVSQGGDLIDRQDLIFKSTLGSAFDITVEDVRGATGPTPSEDDILQIINNIDIGNLIDFPTEPDGDLKGPYVFADKGAQSSAGVSRQKIWGEKAIKNHLSFEPDDPSKTIVDFPDGIGMFTSTFVSSEKNIRSLNFYSQQSGADKTRGLYLGFATTNSPGSANIGIRVDQPQTSLDMKGALRVATGYLMAHNGPGGTGGIGSNQVTIRATGIEYGESLKIYSERGNGKKVEIPHWTVIRNLTVGEGNGLKKGALNMQSGAFGDGNGSHNVRWNSGNMQFVKSTTSRLATPSNSDETATFGLPLDGTLALAAVKQLQPKVVTTDNDVFFTISSDDVSGEAFSVLRDGRTDDYQSVSSTSTETMISLLVKSIQKLEERITALENA